MGILRVGRAERPVPAAAALLCVVALAMLLWGQAPLAAATFPDVPEDHWAYQYIEWLASLGIVYGYWDGYRPDEPVTRAQMAVFIGRTVQHLQPASGLGICGPFDSDLAVVAPPNRDAGDDDYLLYESTDLINFSLPQNATYMGDLEGPGVWWSIRDVTTPRYFKPVAVVNGVERALCEPVMARPGDVSYTIDVSEPIGADIPRVPRVTWTSAPGAVAYAVSVTDLSPEPHDIYRALVDGSMNSICFGQTQGLGVLAAKQWVAALEPYTTYRAGVSGFDSSGWAFVASGDQFFTTGP